MFQVAVPPSITQNRVYKRHSGVYFCYRSRCLIILTIVIQLLTSNYYKNDSTIAIEPKPFVPGEAVMRIWKDALVYENKSLLMNRNKKYGGMFLLDENNTNRGKSKFRIQPVLIR